MQAAQALTPAEPGDGPPAEQPILSADGAMVPLIHGQWAEVKTLVIGEMAAQQEAGAAQCTRLSYFSRMSEASVFTEQASVETARRGVTEARQVCAVMDGAEWIDGLVDLRRPDALRILDFPHAAQAVSTIGQQAGVQELADWLTTQVHELKHQGPAVVLADLDRLCSLFPLNGQMRQQYAYLHKREERMQYPQYQQDGWPLGSGIAESGNKVVMQARLKGAGMHWAPAHVNPMLALRTAACKQRWDQASRQLRAAGQAHRQARREQQALLRLRQHVCRTLLKRAAQREREASPAPPSPPSAKRLPKYSWHQPFLRRPASAKT